MFTILDGVKGWGQDVDTYLTLGTLNKGWWGEDEMKFYLDGDTKFPTICGTGTEDYFAGSHDFDIGSGDSTRYQQFTTSYSGLPQIIRPDGHDQSQMRFGMYRWHILDPVRFAKEPRVTVQDLGWRLEGRFLPLIGMSTREHVGTNLKALELQRDTALLAEIERIVEPVRDFVWVSGRQENNG